MCFVVDTIFPQNQKHCQTVLGKLPSLKKHDKKVDYGTHNCLDVERKGIFKVIIMTPSLVWVKKKLRIKI